MDSRPIAVYGATGHTGRFVLRELERRGRLTVAIARNCASRPSAEVGATQTEWREASSDDPDALDQALRGTCAVINCAGPFLDTAAAVVEAALRAGIHYFDVTAEQRSARQTLATYHDEAIQRGTVVLPAMAFYGGLADLLATEATRAVWQADRIEIGVALDYWHPTQGTRQTADRNTARRLVVADGRLTPIPRPTRPRDWIFPEPFGLQPMVPVPLSEIVTIHRHIAVREVCSYMNSAPLRDLEDARTPLPTASELSGRSSQLFVMDVHAAGGERRSRVTAAGRDIYAVTAPIVAEACLRVLENPPATGGAYAPGELFDPTSFLGALGPQVQVIRSDMCSQ